MVDWATANDSSNGLTRIEIERVRISLDSLKSSVFRDSLLHRINGIENAVMDNPEKALTLPILRRDITGVEKSTREDLNRLESNISSVFVTLQWLIGLVITIALAAIGWIMKSKS